MDVLDELKKLNEELLTAHTAIFNAQLRMIRVTELVEELDPKGEK